jgi:phage-related baseplate assembly protein
VPDDTPNNQTSTLSQDFSNSVQTGSKPTRINKIAQENHSH